MARDEKTMKSSYYLALMLALNLSAAVSAATAHRTETSLSLDYALALVESALEICSEGGYKISVAVVGRAGHLKAQATADGAYLHSAEISRKKAYAALSAGRPTHLTQSHIASNRDYNSAFNQISLGMAPLGGGLPIEYEGSIIGAIAVSGARSAQNSAACAQKALARVISGYSS
jgi:uncharacterized protein GlcG (DUF336 family)